MESMGNTRRIFITGGRCRIGAALAQAFAAAGWRVVIQSREDVGKTGIQADLATVAGRAGIIAKACELAGGRLDCLINNASVYQRGGLSDLTDGEMEEAFQVNCWSALDLMKQFRVECGSGSIINILDQKIARTEVFGGGYLLAKKCLAEITKTAALEWAPEIRVNGVAPGVVMPPPGIGDGALERIARAVPLGALQSSSDITDACMYLASARSVTGHILYVDGGLHLTDGNLGEPIVKKIYKG